MFTGWSLALRLRFIAAASRRPRRPPTPGSPARRRGEAPRKESTRANSRGTHRSQAAPGPCRGVLSGSVSGCECTLVPLHYSTRGRATVDHSVTTAAKRRQTPQAASASSCSSTSASWELTQLEALDDGRGHAAQEHGCRVSRHLPPRVCRRLVILACFRAAAQCCRLPQACVHGALCERCSLTPGAPPRSHTLNGALNTTFTGLSVGATLMVCVLSAACGAR